MSSRQDVLARIEESGVVAVLRLRDPSRMDEVLESLGAAGISVMEITTTVPGAIELISRYVTKMGGEYMIGCGTVLDGSAARRALDAGADFLVSPVLSVEMVEEAHSRGRLAIPAALTPTEAWRARGMGCEAVKLFPARSLGPKYIADLRGPMHDLKVIPAGGVTAENAGDFIRAGAIAVFSGSSIVNDGLVEAGRFRDIERAAREMLTSVSEARNRVGT